MHWGPSVQPRTVHTRAPLDILHIIKCHQSAPPKSYCVNECHHFVLTQRLQSQTICFTSTFPISSDCWRLRFHHEVARGVSARALGAKVRASGGGDLLAGWVLGGLEGAWRQPGRNGSCADKSRRMQITDAPWRTTAKLLTNSNGD